MRSHADSGFSTTPKEPDVTGSRMISGRASPIANSSMMVIRSLFFDGVGEQHCVDALLERAPLGGIRSGGQAVQFCFHLPGMRRQHQDAAADLHRFLNRVGDEYD